MRRVSTRVGVLCGGLVAAFTIAWIAVDLRQRAMQDTDPQASGGMYAFGDLLLGIGVFGLLALVPLAMALYWLRSAVRFWSAMAWGALLFASTGLLALAMNRWMGASESGWMILSYARVGLMPLTALAFLTGAIFAPLARQRWLLVAAAGVDGVVFVGVVLVKFIAPRLGG